MVEEMHHYSNKLQGFTDRRVRSPNILAEVTAGSRAVLTNSVPKKVCSLNPMKKHFIREWQKTGVSPNPLSQEEMAAVYTSILDAPVPVLHALLEEKH